MNEEPLPLKAAITSALRYWEVRRLVYNGVLAAIVIGYFVAYLPQSKQVLSIEPLFFLFVLAVGANICYCAAYVVEIFVQLSGFRETWLRVRGILLLVGIVLAGIFARWFCLAFLPARD